jgi:hypothetical protein
VTYRYATDQSHYNIAPGETVTVLLKLIEERGSASDASLLIDEGGIFGFDVKVERQSGSASITDAAANAGLFDLPIGTSYQPAKPWSPAGVAMLEFATSSLDDPGPTGTQDGLIRELLLGTLTITLPASPSEFSSFLITDSGLGTNTVTNMGTPLDGLIAAVGFTVQVPEPTGLAIAALGVMSIASRRRCRRGRSQPSGSSRGECIA